MLTSQAVKRAQKEIMECIFAAFLLEDIRKLRQILKDLSEEEYEWGVEQTKSCIGDWHKP